MTVTIRKSSDHGDESNWTEINIDTIEDLLKISKENDNRNIIVGTSSDKGVFVEIVDDWR